MSDLLVSCERIKEPREFLRMDKTFVAGIGPYAFDNIAPETMGYEDDRTGECLDLSVSTQNRKS